MDGRRDGNVSLAAAAWLLDCAHAAPSASAGQAPSVSKGVEPSGGEALRRLECALSGLLGALREPRPRVRWTFDPTMIPPRVGGSGENQKGAAADSGRASRATPRPVVGLEAGELEELAGQMDRLATPPEGVRQGETRAGAQPWWQRLAKRA